MAFIKLDNIIYEVLKTDHLKMGRGQGVDRFWLKNLTIGTVIERTFKGNQEAEEVEIEKRKLQFLYVEKDIYYFMDNSTFEQYELSEKIVGDSKDFLKDGNEVEAVFYQNVLLKIEIPTKVQLEVTAAEPATKGNSVDSPTKTIELETGLKVFAPLFIKTGDRVIINTETKKYVERAK